MSDTKLLQSILDKVSSVGKKVSTLAIKVDEGFKEVNKRFDGTDKRINTLGLQLARLEDDSPTIEEFDKLKKRVSNLVTQASKN